MSFHHETMWVHKTNLKNLKPRSIIAGILFYNKKNQIALIDV